MKKIFGKLLIIIFLILISVNFYSCRDGDIENLTESYTDKNITETLVKTIKPTPTPKIDENKEIMKLLPDKEGFEWKYSGFAEYSHAMTLKSIEKDEEITTFYIEGNVFDASDGETGDNPDAYKLRIEYSVSDGILLRTKREKKMMDSFFDVIELIRYPMEKGMEWSQIAMDKEGHEVEIETRIMDIYNTDDKKVYKVKYKDRNSDYYEIREIKEGTGVISYTRLWKDQDNNSFEIGYSLFLEN
jgi:hypothetical protein